MKSLIILKGLSKVYKKNWVERERLDNYFLDINVIRKMLSCPDLITPVRAVLGKSFGDTVYHRFLEAVCLRMSRGCLIVIDPDSEPCEVFETLAMIHGYTVFYVYQTPPQDYLQKFRKYSIPYYPTKRKADIEKEHKAHLDFDMSGKNIIKTFKDVQDYWIKDIKVKGQVFKMTGKVLLVSDIHSNVSLFKKLPDFRSYDRVVFMGDYIDGPESGGSKKMIDKVIKSKSPRLLWLEGNHELRLRRYLGYIMLKEFGKRGLAELLYSTLPEDFVKTTANEFSGMSGTTAKKYLEKMNEKLCMFAIINSKYILTHSGLKFREQLDPRFIGNVIYGNRDMGRYDKEFSTSHEKLGMWSIHAHCKYFDKWETQRYPRVVNLDPPSENELVYAELGKDGIIKICLLEK